ncbi:DUF4019 domain-containing protein [Ningiella sp. W23]|uniref:DUF4019 domain-containing protein n=1 Tax=Ningiella sp. W23 TaxID=3023715 RepID=UPI00375730B6
MDMKVSASSIIEKRKEKAWSQQHLADVSGLSLRTIQRIENTGASSPDSIKAIAMAFNLLPADLMESKAIVQTTSKTDKGRMSKLRKSVFASLAIGLALTVGASAWFTAVSSQPASQPASTGQLSTENNPQLETAKRMALAWLAITDSGNYEQSWQQSDDLFKSQVSEAQWRQALDGVRAPLGQVNERQHQTAKYTKTMPGLPDGEHTILTFSTQFENKAHSVETVTLRKSNETWQVIGYFIR